MIFEDRKGSVFFSGKGEVPLKGEILRKILLLIRGRGEGLKGISHLLHGGDHLSKVGEHLIGVGLIRFPSLDESYLVACGVESKPCPGMGAGEKVALHQQAQCTLVLPPLAESANEQDGVEPSLGILEKTDSDTSIKDQCASAVGHQGLIQTELSTQFLIEIIGGFHEGDESRDLDARQA